MKKRREGGKKVEEGGPEREKRSGMKKSKWLLRFLRRSPARTARCLLLSLSVASEA